MRLKLETHLLFYCVCMLRSLYKAFVFTFQISAFTLASGHAVQLLLLQ